MPIGNKQRCTDQIATLSTEELRHSLPDIVDALQEAGLSVSQAALNELEDIADLSGGELEDLVIQLGLGKVPLHDMHGNVWE